VYIERPDHNLMSHSAHISLIYAWALLQYVIFVMWVCSVTNMLLSVKFTEDKVLTLIILRKKNAKIVQL